MAWMLSRALVLIALAGLSVLVPTVVATDRHVHIRNIAFDPSTVTVLAGSAVGWDNHDGVPHTVTANDGSFHSGDLFFGGSYSRTFNTVGTVAYHCAYHPSMTATINVVSQLTAPSEPRNLQAVPGPAPIGQATLTWARPLDDGGEPIKYYRIYRESLTAPETLVATVGGNTHAYVNTGVPLGFHTYRVSAENDIGEGSKSNDASVFVVGLPG